MLAQGEVLKRIKPVDIAPLLAVLDKLEFADSGGVCAWVTRQGSVAPPEFNRVVEALDLGGRPRRLFCRKLMPRQGIAPHVDVHGWMRDCRRFHVPLTSDPKIRMRWPEDKIEAHLEPGYLYEVRVDRPHEVVNEGDVERIHIQIDQEGATI